MGLTSSAVALTECASKPSSCILPNMVYAESRSKRAVVGSLSASGSTSESLSCGFRFVNVDLRCAPIRTAFHGRRGGRSRIGHDWVNPEEVARQTRRQDGSLA